MIINKFIPCRACKDGFIYSENKVVSCQCRLDWEKNSLLLTKSLRSGLPLRIKIDAETISIVNYDIDKHYFGEDLEDNKRKIKLYIDKFEDKFRNISLYLFSKNNSTQKTTIAAYVGIQLISKGFTVKFILMDYLIKSLMVASFDNNKKTNIDAQKTIRECKKADCLIIDDSFDKNKVTLYQSGYQLSYLDSFLRDRIDHKKNATIFTSNTDINNIGKDFGVNLEKMIERNVEKLFFNDTIYFKEKRKDIWNT